MKLLLAREERVDPFQRNALRTLARFIGLQNGVSAVLFGGMLLMPWSTFSVSQTYEVMASHWSEPVWGAVYLLLGAGQVFAHYLPFSWLYRGVMAVAWFYVAFVFLTGDYRSTGWPQYSWDAANASIVFAIEGALALRAWRR